VKQLLIYLGILLFILTSFNSYAQKGYRIEGDSVVFSFDRRDYDNATNEYHKERVSFEDLNIENVVVSGEFNNWSTNNWYMTKVNENKYELKKSIHDFSDEFSWEFKFVINNSYWAEPKEMDGNTVEAVKNGLRLINIYNLKMYTAYPDKNGNAIFRLKGYVNASEVIISGSFNKWDVNLFKMNKIDDGWELKLQIKPGVYQYRFIVDGNWMEDPDNTHKIENEFGEYNSLLDIKEFIAFKLRGYHAAKKVILAGSFNDWNEKDLVMEKTYYGWKYVIPLSYGKYHYKFIVDGQWVLDPNNPVIEYDEEGNVNSVCMVK